MRRWDLRAAHTASAYVTISSVVQARVHSGYGLSSTVLPAPRPDTDTCPSEPMPHVERWLDGGGFELCVSRLLPYKNVDQVVAAYAQEPHRKLIVVGRGPQKPALRAAASSNVLFLENITDGQLAWLYRRSQALIAISYEDFGLTPLEAAAFGKPSIVLRWGGFVETMVQNLTAVFVEVPEAEHVRHALEQLDARDWDADRIIEHAARYHEDVFVEDIRELVKAQLEQLDRSWSRPAMLNKRSWALPHIGSRFTMDERGMTTSAQPVRRRKFRRHVHRCHVLHGRTLVCAEPRRIVAGATGRAVLRSLGRPNQSSW